MIVLDDLGFAQLGCFGSDVDTPHLDRLAASGLRFNRFHVTAICSPTRACLLTGRNHHAVGMGFFPDLPMGFPGYSGRIPRSAATLPRILRDTGYSTMAVGKWHLTPRFDITFSGPFDHWPLGLGFQHFYGFLGAETNQWTPELVCDNHFVEPPRTPQEGYHLTQDLVDVAIQFVQDQHQATPDRPFFCYLATGAQHAPHQAPPEWIARYAGRFDDGWEAWRERTFRRQVDAGVVPAGTVLSPRPSWIPAWDELPADQQRLYARMQEVFAGFLSHTDHHLGRFLAHLEALGLLEDTLVVVLSDNGASAEGGIHGSVNENRFATGEGGNLQENLAHLDDLGGFRLHNHYAWGWAWAGNAPLPLWKHHTWLGGSRTPLIVHWPAGIHDGGAVRHQFCHAVDLMPTILDAAGVALAETVDGVSQQPVDGASILGCIRDAAAPSPRRTQYFEMVGSRGIYCDGWMAQTDHVADWGEERTFIPGSASFASDRWLLFNLEEDFAQADDLSGQHPERLRDLVELWFAEAGRNSVLPIDDSVFTHLSAAQPSPHPPWTRAVYRPGHPVAGEVVPRLGGSFRITAEVDIPDAGAEGVLCAQGNWTSGFAFYVLDGRPVFAFNAVGAAVYRAVAAEAVLPGCHTVAVEVTRHSPRLATAVLSVDGRAVGQGSLDHPIPFLWQIGGAPLSVGRDRGFPVCDDYEVPFAFSGTLDRIVIDVPDAASPDPLAIAEDAARRH
jgi:arylsulfatase